MRIKIHKSLKFLFFLFFLVVMIGYVGNAQKSNNRQFKNNQNSQLNNRGGGQANQNKRMNNQSNRNNRNSRYFLNCAPLSDLSQNEIDGLLLMREEEKLARDVYLTLGNKWNLQAFYNIADSEQMHTDAVKSLLDLYQIEDPVKTDQIGQFTSGKLQDLYNDLVEKGTKSARDALQVGVTIEDLDIYDLSELLKSVENQDVKAVYENLLRGSRNHLRSFNYQLNQYEGEQYAVQYITQDMFDEIISSQQERGFQQSSMRRCLPAN